MRFVISLLLTATVSLPALAQLELTLSPTEDVTHYARLDEVPTNQTTFYLLENDSNFPIPFNASWDPNASPSGGSMLVAFNGQPGVRWSDVLAAGQSMTISVYVPSSLWQVDVTHTLRVTTPFAPPIERRHTIDIGANDVTVTPETVPIVTVPYRPSGPVYEWDFDLTNNHPYYIPVTSWSDLEVEVPLNDQSFDLEGQETRTVSVRVNDQWVERIGRYDALVEFRAPDSGAQLATRTISFDYGRYPSTETASLPIEDLATTTSQIYVPDAYCLVDSNQPVAPGQLFVEEIGVELELAHTYIGDLEVSLETPDGTVIALHNRTGGSDDDLRLTYEFGDADGPGDLRDLKGILSAGTWTLRVTDNAAGDVGALESWALRLPGTNNSDCAPRAIDQYTNAARDAFTDVTLEAYSARNYQLQIDTLPAGDLIDPNQGLVTSVPFTTSGPNLLYLPQIDGGLDQFTYSVVELGNGGTASAAVNLISAGAETVYYESLDTDPNWVTEGLWALGTPAGPDDPTGTFGSQVYAYNLAGTYEPFLPETHLTTTPYDFTNVTGAELRFLRWLQVERSIYDMASVSASRDGVTWEPIWTHDGPDLVDTAWQQVSYDLSSFDGEPTVFIRWTMGTTDSNVQFTGWNIDEIEILSTGVACVGDVNGDGLVDLSDLATLLANFGESGATPAMGDLDNDGNVALSDLAILLGNFGC